MKYAVLIATLLGLAACNTIKGAGEDIAAGGEAVADTAEEVKEDINQTY